MLFIGAALCFIIMIVKDNININTNIYQEDSLNLHYLRKLSEDSLKPIFHHHHGSNIPLRKSRKYFIDFGANSGDTVQHFINQKQVNEGNVAFYNYDIRGLGSDGDWHVVAVEANPTYTNQLEDLKANYIRDHKVQSFELFSGTAVYTRYDG